MSEQEHGSVLDTILRSPRFWAAVISLLQVMAAIVQGQIIENTETTQQDVEQTQQDVEQTQQDVKELKELLEPTPVD